MKTNSVAGDQRGDILKFPEAAFVGLFADYRDLVSPTTEAPDQFAWASLLASLSAVIGRQTKLEGGPDGVSPILHVGILGRTGKARKSTAMDDAVTLFVDAIPAAVEAAATSPVQLQAVDGKAVRPAAVRRRPSVARGLEVPLEVVRGAGSGEGLAEALADTEEQKGKRALFVVDEMGALLEKAGRGQAGNLVDLLLRLYDAPGRFEHRTRKSSFTVTGGSGVFLGASTVEWVHRTLTEAHVRRGLVSRFIWVLGDRKGTPMARRPAIDRAAHQRFVELAVERVGSALGKTLSLTASADRFHQRRYEADYHEDEESDLRAAASARSDGLALRLALLLAIADGSKVVDRRHVEAGWAVVDYSRGVAGSLVDQISAKGTDTVEERVLRAAKRVGAAASNGIFARHEVYQRVKGPSGIRSEAFERAWQQLVSAGELVEKSRSRWQLHRGGLPQSPNPQLSRSPPAHQSRERVNRE